MGAGQACGAVAGGEGAVRTHVGQAHQGVGDHGDVVGGHQRDVVRGAPLTQRVAGRGVKRIVKGLARAPLLGRQGLVDRVGVARVVAFALALGAGLLGGLLAAALVLAVVQSGEGQDVEEEQRRPDCNGDAELRGVISGVRHDQRTHLSPSLTPAVGRGYGRPPRAAGPLPVGLGGIQRSDFGGGGGVIEYSLEVVEMGHQVFPEGHFGGTVVVTDARLQADVQVKLVIGVILRPGYLLEAVSLGVDKLGVLRHWLVRIPVNRSEKTWVVKDELLMNTKTDICTESIQFTHLYRSSIDSFKLCLF